MEVGVEKLKQKGGVSNRRSAISSLNVFMQRPKECRDRMNNEARFGPKHGRLQNGALAIGEGEGYVLCRGGRKSDEESYSGMIARARWSLTKIMCRGVQGKKRERS